MLSVASMRRYTRVSVATFLQLDASAGDFAAIPWQELEKICWSSEQSGVRSVEWNGELPTLG